MKHIVVLIVSCLLATACVQTPEQIEAQKQAQMQQDFNTCSSYGFRPNSDAFRNCLLQLDIARQQQQYYYDHYSYDPYPHFYGGYYYLHR